MNNNITLTIDEIHTLREEHCQKTAGLCFAEYRKLLDDEIAPVLDLLNQAKVSPIMKKDFVNNL